MELKRKLMIRRPTQDDFQEVSKAQWEEWVETVLNRMVETDLQSDVRFAQSYVRSRAGRCGLSRLKRELSDKGIQTELVEQALEEELPDDELTRARSVWTRKFTSAPTDHKEWARQARFLQTRGFAVDVIRKLLKEPFDESA